MWKHGRPVRWLKSPGDVAGRHWSAFALGNARRHKFDASHDAGADRGAGRSARTCHNESLAASLLSRKSGAQVLRIMWHRGEYAVVGRVVAVIERWGLVGQWRAGRVKIESASPKAEDQRARAREEQRGTIRPGRVGLSVMACDAQFDGTCWRGGVKRLAS
jgi:hypothetical protein